MRGMQKISSRHLTEDKVYHIYLNDQCIHHNLTEGEFTYWMLQHKGVKGTSYEGVRGMSTNEDHSC